MAMLFSAAAAYLGLKVGQVFEAAIPIAIIAVGVSTAAHRSKALGENVIIKASVPVRGAVSRCYIHIACDLYSASQISGMSASFLKIFISSLLGGIIGILFLIPFRKYFVKEMHGKYPFPRSYGNHTGAGEWRKGGGSQAKPLIIAGIIGGLYDFIVATFGWWNENFTTRVIGWGRLLADKAKLVFKVNTGLPFSVWDTSSA